jgi:hypothetical protein
MDEHNGQQKPRRFRRFRFKRRKPHFSQILREIADDGSRERISVRDLLLEMGDRAFGALMLIFALPNAIPAPPGTSAILGAPLVFLAAQMTFGRKPWLPKIIADRSMTRTDFVSLVERLGPWLARAERLLKPRLSGLTTGPMEYVIGFCCLVLSVILILPIPLGNMLPALAICLFCFGILERDGVWVIAGFLVGAISVFIVGGVVYALFKTALFVLDKAIE